MPATKRPSQQHAQHLREPLCAHDTCGRCGQTLLLSRPSLALASQGARPLPTAVAPIAGEFDAGEFAAAESRTQQLDALRGAALLGRRLGLLRRVVDAEAAERVLDGLLRRRAGLRHLIGSR